MVVVFAGFVPFVVEVHAAAAGEVRLNLQGKIDLPELSGLTRSRRQAGVFWTIADSKNPRHLHAISSKGRRLASFQVVGVNLDWESIAADSVGNLYIADCGNNLRLLPRRWIYVVKEPSVSMTTTNLPTADRFPSLKPVRRLEFSFPNRPFDIEATFVFADRLVLIEKTRNESAGVYSMSLESSATQTLRPETSISGIESITGAAITSTGQLFVCGTEKLAAFDLARPSGSLQLTRRAQPRLSYSQSAIESCAAMASGVLLLSEDGSLFSFPMTDRR